MSKPIKYKKMKYLIMLNRSHLFSLMISCFIFSAQIYAQTDKNEVKLQNLKNKIAVAESNVAAAELKLSIADSLISDSDLRILHAEEEFSRIGEEQKKLEKEYNISTKTLKKLVKSKDLETAKKAEDELKALDTKYKEDTNSKAAEIKILTKRATKAKSDGEKGLDMQKSAGMKLKDAQKALDLARKNYEAFSNTLESE